MKQVDYSATTFSFCTLQAEEAGWAAYLVCPHALHVVVSDEAVNFRCQVSK